MQSPATPIPSRAEYHRSCQLITEAYGDIALAKDLIAHARRARARQQFLRVVCAWCQRPMGWERCDESAHGQVSHGICDDRLVQRFPGLHARLPIPVHLP